MYRYVEESWIGKQRDVNFRRRFRFLTADSCNIDNCTYCDWIDDALAEQLSDDIGSIEGTSTAVIGRVYNLTVVDESVDWETGYVDDFTFGFVERPDETVQQTK